MRANRMLAAVVASAISVLGPAAHAYEKTGTPFLIVSTVTYHTRNDEQLNDSNPGAGLGIAFTQHVGVVAGSFRNSYSLQSRYAMLRLRPFESLPVHLCGGYLDGYGKYAGTALPLGAALDLELGPLVIVAMPEQHGGAALSLWLRLDP